MRAAFLVLLLALVGCQTGAEYQAQQEEHLRNVIGLTMAEFMQRTGLVPSTMFETATGRTFIVEGRSVTLVTQGSYGAPTVANTQTCRIQLQTSQSGSRSGPDAWRIVDVNWTGPCSNSY